ncbi:hypothetical protein H0H81_009396 [Sphagnurus paluster]|uniref:Homeobox domain-containing protein n=1 Tax=Sphagnurus paluster TaxID=117069 RepID=A0A9P7G105_9AGAR|nr:hypothetical protein H0H81_009396 [Sphagnurus paluster]
MDTLPVPLPTKAKPNFQRANPEQLRVLKAGFAISDVSSKEHLAALSETTGLSTKWIASWFMRERRKQGVSLPRGAAKKDKKLAQEKIMAFKAEHQDTAITLLSSDDLILDSTSEQKPDLSLLDKKQTRKPKKKCKIDESIATDDIISSSPLKLPLVSVSLTPPIRPTISPPHGTRPQVQSRSSPSPASSFVLRPMVVMYTPSVTSRSLEMSLDPAPIAPSSVSMTQTNRAIHSPRASSLAVDLANGRHEQALTHQRLLNFSLPLTSESMHAFYDRPAYSHQPNLHEKPLNRPLRPILPLHGTNQYPAHALRTLPASHVIRTTKENITPSILPYHRPFKPAQPPPLYSYNNLDRFNHQPCPSAMHTSAPPPRHQAPLLQPLAPVFDPFQQNRAQMNSALLDPSATPLKHLSVLGDSPGDLPQEEIMHRLLDERLAYEDPFQAAMGLVFVSRLGLGWNYT